MVTPPIWRCGRFELTLDAPIVMGVINVTPDSFSDGGEHVEPHEAVAHGLQLLEDGAVVLDVGGESTRPGAEPVTPPEELARVRPVIARLAEEPVPISIDTRHAEVARAAIDAGASILNDVSGFRSPEMVGVAADGDAGVVVMHMLGEPHTMQRSPHYADVVAEVAEYLALHVSVLEASGVAPERIAIDPGLGFGKTLEHNLALIDALPRFAELGYPVVIGASRKRMIGELTGVDDPRARVGGSVAVALHALARGAHVVRVHDVSDTVQAIAVSEVMRAQPD